ncbi:MAG TPA: hypothetical protein VE444_01535 [Gaiellaceae bacterium]|jgi:hypothetical protein|nr:hypothetical protein [Gaiellaceae bacterium]
MKRAVFAAVALLSAMTIVVAAAAAGGDNTGGDGIKEHAQFGRLAETQYDGGIKAGSAKNMEAIAHVDLAARGFNADVWAHEGYAYVGQWGFNDWAGGNSRFCPDDPVTRGVAVVDARVPAQAKWVSRLEHPVGSSVEDVVVFTARYGEFAGRDIAVAGIQNCLGSRYDIAAQRGLMLWDVTHPESPLQIAYFKTACCTRGVHELEVQHRTDLGRTFVYASVPTSGYPDPGTPSGVRDQFGHGDFRLFDITNPRSPVQVGEWGIHDVGTPFQALGCDADGNYGHSAEPSEDGKLAFVAYWDSGFIALDVSNPAKPTFKGTTTYGLDEDGDGHSSQYDEGRKLLFSADEDFCKTSGSATEKGFGYLRVWDYSKLNAPKQIGEYKTPNASDSTDKSAGDYTIHNNFLVGTTLFTSWYSDGVRMIDVSNPRAPEEIGYFVPPATTNPIKPSQRGVLTNTTQVWGVVVENGLVYASDMNSGLWILRPKR